MSASGDHIRSPAPSAALTAAGVDHVRLSYHYLDSRDVEGYLSLLSERVWIRYPDADPVHGHAQAAEFHGTQSRLSGTHTLYQVFGQASHIVAIGRLIRTSSARGTTGAPADVDFADVFVLDSDGLILGQRRFLH
ncbi:nuclear transport factor 2 family protein [Nocardiopsis sp. ATB16-24]|uniref:nuclear transport factor 2 family protein n=1 Tax=Nocardiopsis sp. ATB16-24 TaxID=3019555 RepID=UPI0025542D6B|nr:nuclear transport factor 2 family protein [Nocardiopsis sp. ATB16-24]